MAELKDSGARRNFNSGAVRDIADGKGRADLLPLDIISDRIGGKVLHWINEYIWKGEIAALWFALDEFVLMEGIDIYTAFIEASKQYEDGAKKYGDNNWRKGIPVHCYIDSGVRHYLKFMRGDKDEPHSRAFIWNLLSAIWTHENKPELIDLPFVEDKL